MTGMHQVCPRLDPPMSIHHLVQTYFYSIIILEFLHPCTKINFAQLVSTSFMISSNLSWKILFFRNCHNYYLICLHNVVLNGQWNFIYCFTVVFYIIYVSKVFTDLHCSFLISECCLLFITVTITKGTWNECF